MTGGREKKKKKEIRRTHWINLSDLILHRWLEEAHRLRFVSSCFSHMWFSVMQSSTSSVAPMPSITRRLRAVLHVICVRSNMPRRTVLLSHYTARCTEYFIHNTVRWFHFEQVARTRSERASFVNKDSTGYHFPHYLKTNATGQIASEWKLLPNYSDTLRG